MNRTKPGRASRRRGARGGVGISRRTFLGAVVAAGAAGALGLVRERGRQATGLSLREADYYRRDGLAG